MKRIYFSFLLISTILFSSYAQDTMTGFQVFNYEVGDAFYTRTQNINQSVPPTYRKTHVIGKFTSPTKDTLKFEVQDSNYTLENRRWTLSTATRKLDYFHMQDFAYTANVYNDFDSLYQGVDSCGSKYEQWFFVEPHGELSPYKFWVFTYYEGIGMISTLGNSEGSTIVTDLLYYIKNGEKCGERQSFLGIKPIHFKPLTIYPNPSQDYIVFGEKEMERVSIYSADGRLITTLNPNSNAVDISFLTPGLYFVETENDQEIAFGKFMKK